MTTRRRAALWHTTTPAPHAFTVPSPLQCYLKLKLQTFNFWSQDEDRRAQGADTETPGGRPHTRNATARTPRGSQLASGLKTTTSQTDHAFPSKQQASERREKVSFKTLAFLGRFGRSHSHKLASGRTLDPGGRSSLRFQRWLLRRPKIWLS